MPRIRIDVKKHVKTGVWAAMSEDLPGFIVHAQSDDELQGKLAPAFKHFMEAIGQAVHDVKVTQSTPEGFWPPSYIASGELDKIAA